MSCSSPTFDSFKVEGALSLAEVKIFALFYSEFCSNIYAITFGTDCSIRVAHLYLNAFLFDCSIRVYQSDLCDMIKDPGFYLATCKIPA